LNLSPYELKMMLHHILSGKEFMITTGKSPQCTSVTLSIVRILRFLDKAHSDNLFYFVEDRRGELGPNAHSLNITLQTVFERGYSGVAQSDIV